MKNKFEALKAFQSWPREWQELCAEYWAEGDASVPAASQEPSKPALPAIGDPFPYDGPKIGFGCIDNGEAKVEATPKKKGRERWSIKQQEYLVKCMDQCGVQKRAAEMFLRRYPGRSVGAVQIRIWEMLDINGVMKVNY